MSTTRKLRGGTGNGDETLLVRPTTPPKPERVEAPHTVNTLTADDELPAAKTYLYVTAAAGKNGSHVRLKPHCEQKDAAGKNGSHVRLKPHCEQKDAAGKNGSHVRLKPHCEQKDATVDDVLLVWTAFKKSLPPSMTPVLTTWLAEHPDLPHDVVDEVIAIVEAEERALSGTDEHPAITVEMPAPVSAPAPTSVPAPRATRVDEPPTPPAGFVSIKQQAVRSAIRNRVAKVALATVLAIPVVAAIVALFAATPAIALWTFIGLSSVLVFVGPPIYDGITNGLFRFVTVKLWVELGATALTALGIGCCLLFGSVEASVVMIGLAVIGLLFKNAVITAAMASTKMTVVEVREEVIAPPAPPAPVSSPTSTLPPVV
jgi:hypothetical protein